MPGGTFSNQVVTNFMIPFLIAMIVEGLEPRVWIRNNVFPASAFVPDKRPEAAALAALAALPHPCPAAHFQIKWRQDTKSNYGQIMIPLVKASRSLSDAKTKNNF